MTDIADLKVLDLKVENEDPLPENFLNLGTMHHAAAAIGNLINSIICWVQMHSSWYPRLQFKVAKNEQQGEVPF